jgi:AraC-like DNA-binding protein
MRSLVYSAYLTSSEGGYNVVSRIIMSVCGKTRPLTLSSGERTKPLLNSAATCWAGLPFEVHVMGPVDSNITAGPVMGEYGILVIISGQVDIVLREDKREIYLTGAPGTAYLLAGDRPLNLVRITGLAQAAAVQIPLEWFGRVSLNSAPPTFALTEPLFRDQNVLGLVKAMRNEVAGGSMTGRLYAESLSIALLSYIIERIPYSSMRFCGRFSDSQCRRLQKYIHDFLYEDLSLSELADVVQLSPRHFSMRFREAFGVTPHQYVLRKRLAEAARLLESEGEDIAEIALRSGFSSQSHLTSAFRRFYGMTPGRYAAEKRKCFIGFQPTATNLVSYNETNLPFVPGQT